VNRSSRRSTSSEPHLPPMTGPDPGVRTPAPRLDPEDFRLTRLRPLRGPNFWRLAPVIACDVTLGSLEGVTSNDLPELGELLLTALPSLHDHPCSYSEHGFVDSMRSGTQLPHILEHVALELQTLAGADVSFGRVVRSGDEGVWWLMVAYEEEEVGLESLRDGVNLLKAAIAGEIPDAREAVDRLYALREQVRFGPSTAAIVEEARRRRIPVRRLNSRSLVQLGLGKNLRRIQASMSDYTSAIAVEIAQDKDDTRRVLENVGLPVPAGGAVASLGEAVTLARTIGFPVILKPLDSSQGRGISSRLDTEAALALAWPIAREYSSRLVVERYVSGRDFRVLVVGGRTVAVAERIAAHVTGDGQSSIQELIDEANRDPRRGPGHARTLTHLPSDIRTVDFLATRGLSLYSIPRAGETIPLRATANLSTGGSSIDRTDDIHPENVTAAELAAGIVGLDIAGIDVLSPDLSVPFRENGGVIIEVNASPGIRMHTHPGEGSPRNVAAPVIDMLYPPGSESDIPVVAVTGTNGKTTTVRLTAHLFRQTGRTVGLTTTDGVYLQDRLVMGGDMTGPFSANIILSNPSVEVAVLETARGGILRAGLGFDECDVGVVLNVTADHLGHLGIHTLDQLADVKSVIAAVVKRDGHAVLNADDPRVYAMRERTSADIVLFSTSQAGSNALVEDHIARGGITGRLEEDTFVIRRGRLRIPIAQVGEVPLTFGGAARFQFGNVLAAIMSAYVQGVRYDTIRAGLLSFFPSPSMTPGRLNLLRVRNAQVLLDYAHNAVATEGLMEVVGSIPAVRRIGVVAVPGDRRDDDIRAVGRHAAALDHVVIKEDADRRGRRAGEVAALIQEGLRSGGLPDDRMEVIPSEPDAVEHVLNELGDGDLAVILAENVSGVLRQISQQQGAP
jgi:cyanophycin synthetase